MEITKFLQITIGKYFLSELTPRFLFSFEINFNTVGLGGGVINPDYTIKVQGIEFSIENYSEAGFTVKHNINSLQYSVSISKYFKPYDNGSGYPEADIYYIGNSATSFNIAASEGSNPGYLWISVFGIFKQ